MNENRRAFEIVFGSIWGSRGPTIDSMEWARDNLQGVLLMAIALGDWESRDDAEFLRDILRYLQDELRGEAA